MNWETVIGLEVHVQLNTRSKIFSGAPTDFCLTPNAQACAVDLALPGTLPVLNREAVLMALQFGLAIGAEISETTVFYRKNYFYPDLPKGYQISQLGEPIVGGGYLQMHGDPERRLRIERAHLEEDAGKSLHHHLGDRTGIDLNRAGTPLLEVVTAPEIDNAKAAGEWFRTVHHLVCYLGICNGVMAEGSLRCDANISLRPAGEAQFGERVEIKNLNSFRFVEQALNLEIKRQRGLLEQGASVERETRLYDPEKQQTRPMRSKEFAEDYRYFPEPDLLPLQIDASLLEEARGRLPELPAQRMARYAEQHGFDGRMTQYLCQDTATGDYFDALVRQGVSAKQAANWIMGELAAINNNLAVDMSDTPLASNDLATLIGKVESGALSAQMAKDLAGELARAPADTDVEALITEQGLAQISGDEALQQLVDEALSQHPEQVRQYHLGKTKILGFLVGQVMKASGGQANPKIVNKLMVEALKKPG